MCCLTCRQGCGGDCAQARCHHRQQIVLQRSLQAGEHQPSQQVSTSVSGACVKAAVIWLKPHCLHAVSVLTSLASCQVCIEALSCLTCGKCSISVSIHFLVSKFSSDVYFLIFPAWPSANTDCGFISKSKLELLFFFSLVWFLFFFSLSRQRWKASLTGHAAWAGLWLLFVYWMLWAESSKPIRGSWKVIWGGGIMMGV